jgi:hypothetical protein
MGILERSIKLPAVKRVCIVVDDIFIRACLKKKKAEELQNVKWPEAIKAIYKQAEQAENKLLHIESVCRKARETQITPFKNKIWNMIIKHNVMKE